MKKLMGLVFYVVFIAAGTFASFHNTSPFAAVYAQDDPNRPYTTGAFPRAMEFDGTNVWVANWIDNSITVLDATDGSIVKTLRGRGVVGQRPVALAWDGSYMWVANWQDNRVFRLTPDGELQFAVGPSEGIQQPIALMYDGAHIWILNQGTGQQRGSVTKIVTRTLEILGSYPVGRFPTGMVWDGENIWVPSGLDDTVTVLDAASGQQVAEIEINNMAISIAFDGIHVWISHYDGTVIRIPIANIDSKEEFKPDLVPGRPVYLFYAFERIWIANSDANSVTNLRARTAIQISTIESEGEFAGTIVATTNRIWVANWLDYSIKPVDVPDALEDTINPAPTVASNPEVWLPREPATPTLFPTFTPTEVICNTPFAPRLRPGDRGRVEDFVNRIPLHLRETPGRETEETIIESIKVGTFFTVLEGPVCINDEWWFRVQLDDTRQGWFIEALKDDPQSGGHYTIEPIAQP